MSVTECSEPVCTSPKATPAVATMIDARTRDVGGHPVRRLLPSRARRTVGPFIFFDHMGPAAFPAGSGVDVRPHPHIGLATVTYLLDGELLHRDSVGSEQAIRPGDVNWMTAGRGIVHSERTPADSRRGVSRLHALQLWVALPAALEECEPSFVHHPGRTLPRVDVAGAAVRVLAGSAYGVSSPVRTPSPLLYLEASLPAGGELSLPGECEERAVYVVEGAIGCGGERAGPGRMLVFVKGAEVALRAEEASRVVLVGGAPIDGERHIFWNFVSSSRERIERAKREWRDGRFPTVPGDEGELEPLPR